MPDIFDGNGLQTKTLTEIIEELEIDYKDIYGSDINLDQNSPDGQLLNIQGQEGVDTRELLTAINNGFDPDQAEGRVLDQRVALNAITRNGGTYTTVSINVTVDQPLNLVGLDDQSEELNPTISNLYIIKDDAGTEFYLVDSQSPAGAGTFAYLFRAAPIGDVQILANTITTPVTVIAGVTGVNNPSGATVQGVDEESDADLKIRRRASTSVSAVGYLDSIEAALRNLDGVVTAIVLENDTGSTDSDGTLAHTIWCIVEGGADADIGAVIYAKKSSGSGQRGVETVNVPREGGGIYVAKFDRPDDEDLYIHFSITLPGGTVDTAALKDLIVENVIWGVGASAVASTITAYVQSLNADYQISGMEVSDDDISYVEILASASPDDRWINDAARITII